MHAIESLVPGFGRALARMPGAVPAWRALTAEASLPDRDAALVELTVAQSAGGEYSRWVIGRLAEKVPMSAEDIFLATAGTARNPREAAIVKAAGAMASKNGLSDTDPYRDLTARLGPDGASRVLSHVALALLACDVLDAAAPGRASPAPSRRGAWP